MSKEMVPESGLEPQFLSAPHGGEHIIDICYPAFVRMDGLEPPTPKL